MKGKTVVILINDPGNEDANPDPAFFKGKAMTYYGRWTYKYEEAARQGAAAAIIVHETRPGRLWLAGGAQFQLRRQARGSTPTTKNTSTWCRSRAGSRSTPPGSLQARRPRL